MFFHSCFSIFLSMVIWMPAAFASKAKTTEQYVDLKHTTARYRKSEMTGMDVVKTVKSELLGSENVFLGNILISEGMLRWETHSPEKTLIVYDGEILWNEQSPPKEFPGPVQVIRAKLDRKNKAQVMIASLLGGTSIFESFKVLNESINNNEISYSLEPKIRDLKLKDLMISVLRKENQINAISYKDDVGNTTLMKFSNIEFNKKKNTKLFRYAPPKGAQVNNL